MGSETSILRVVDELIEQPSWGGDYIARLKGLDDHPEWYGKKIGQAYELAIGSQVESLETGELIALRELVEAGPEKVIGKEAVAAHGPELNLLIKLTQAKGNSFQVHLPEGATLGHWRPKPEAWFYLGPGLYTFGLRAGKRYEDFSAALREIDGVMHALSADVVAGRLSVDAARIQASTVIVRLDPYQFVNLVEAKTDEIVDLTGGGIHHSWEEDNERFPQGNLVYEVQVDVPDDYCSMRGFDKGKFLDSGKVRPTHVHDYLATVSQDPERSDLSRYIQRPQIIASESSHKRESLFRTRHFNLDRLTIAANSAVTIDSEKSVQHLFVFAGQGSLEGFAFSPGQSYLVTAATGSGVIIAGSDPVTILQTWLPV